VRGNVKKGLKVTKNPYKIFVVGCGRRDGVWGAFFEGGGIILVPAILLPCIYFRCNQELVKYYQTTSLERSFPEVPIMLGLPYKDAVNPSPQGLFVFAHHLLIFSCCVVQD